MIVDRVDMIGQQIVVHVTSAFTGLISAVLVTLNKTQ